VPQILKAVLDFILGVPTAIFGSELLSSAWGIVFATMFAITAVIYVIGAIRSFWEFVKALDAGFDKNWVDRENARMDEDDVRAGRPAGDPIKIDWVKARKQQARTFTFVLPLGLIALAIMYMWLRFDFTFMGYVRFALLWLIILGVFIRPWWIWAALRTQRVLEKSGEIKAEDSTLHGMSLGRAIRYYFAWGLQEKVAKRRTFFRFLKWAEPIAGMIGLRWLRIRLAWAILQISFYSAGWFVFGAISPFYLLHELDDRRNLLKPAWASSHAQAPRLTNRIPDTPGDAAAASS